MNRLHKFVEQGGDGEKRGRTAYAFGPDNLPEPSKGLEWKQVTSFRPADELMENAGLVEVFQAAILNRRAVVSREASGDERAKQEDPRPSSKTS